MYKDNRHSDLMQHFRGFLSGPNRCPGCAGHGITDRGTTCKACLGDGKLTSAVRGYKI
jgi:DnaJ-class molecular chaperone